MMWHRTALLACGSRFTCPQVLGLWSDLTPSSSHVDVLLLSWGRKKVLAE